MKLLVLIGGIAGFAIGIACGLAAQCPWPMTVWHACLATCIAASLTRWWSRVWMQSLKQSCRERAAILSKQPRQPVLPYTKP